MRKEDSINRPTDQCFVFNLIKNRFACANSVLILQTLFWSPWWLTIVAQELKFADYDHCTVQTAQYYIQYYCYNTHTHRTLVLCVFVYMRSVPFQGGKGSFFAYLIPSMEAWNHLTRPTCVPPCSIAFQYKEYDPKRMIRNDLRLMALSCPIHWRLRSLGKNS